LIGIPKPGILISIGTSEKVSTHFEDKKFNLIFFHIGIIIDIFPVAVFVVRKK